MKRTALLILIFLLLFQSMALGNSGPVYWHGHPSSSIMSVDDNSPIEVIREDLVFDFSGTENYSYSTDGLVKAAYKMKNPTDEQLSVQMAFPFIGSISSFNREGILILSDGGQLKYDIYIGDRVTQESSNFDFERILGDINKEKYIPVNYSEEQKGKLYQITVEPTTEENINFVFEFNYNHEKTNILVKNFNRFERNGSNVLTASWLREKAILEYFVIGEDIEFNVKAYSDGELKNETEHYNFQVEEKSIPVKEYINFYSQSNTLIPHTQLYNIHAKYIDRSFSQNLGICFIEEMLTQEYEDRVITAVYTVLFPPGSQKDITVTYRTNGSMDRRKTKYPLYSFSYILNPASRWSSFKDLYIEIIPPKHSPYIVDSNVSFTRHEDNIYRASLEELPDDDLYFTFYAKEKVSSRINILIPLIIILSIAGLFLFFIRKKLK